MTRPIIVKLTNALNKSLIFSELRKLKQYNAKELKTIEVENQFLLPNIYRLHSNNKKSIDAIL